MDSNTGGRLKRLSDIYHKQGLLQLCRSIIYFLIIRKSTPDKIRFDLLNKYRNIIHNLRYDNVADPMKAIEIDPDQVQYFISKDMYDQSNGLGRIEGGDWDEIIAEINNHFIYIGLKEHFNEGVGWDDTEYINVAREKIQQRDYFWGYNSITEFKRKRCSYVEKLYNDIQNNGYKSAKEVEYTDEVRHGNDYYPSISEITVGIGRNGEFLLYDGFHRLIIAKLLDIDKTPVMIIVRHKKWQEKRDNIDAFGDCHTPIHPDLKDCLR